MGIIHFLAFSKAKFISSIKSSKSSMPIESLIKSSVIPDFCKSFLLSCACVVLAGCITSDLASPILAKWLAN